MKTLVTFLHSFIEQNIGYIAGWLTLITILLFLLLVFRCFESPYRTTFSSVRSLRDMATRALKARTGRLHFALKKAVRLASRVQRLVDASIYDDPDDDRYRQARDIIQKVVTLMDVLVKGRTKLDEKRVRTVLKALEKQCTAYLSLERR